VYSDVLLMFLLYLFVCMYVREKTSYTRVRKREERILHAFLEREREREDRYREGGESLRIIRIRIPRPPLPFRRPKYYTEIEKQRTYHYHQASRDREEGDTCTVRHTVVSVG